MADSGYQRRIPMKAGRLEKGRASTSVSTVGRQVHVAEAVQKPLVTRRFPARTQVPSLENPELRQILSLLVRNMT